MKEYGVYRVTGKRQYRGHDPGTTFEACIDAAVERRAVDRGDIVLMRRVTPDLTPGSFVLSDNWPPGGRAQAASTKGRREAPLSLGEGG